MRSHSLRRLFRSLLTQLACVSLVAAAVPLATSAQQKSKPTLGPPLVSQQDAVRFLEQATWGPTPALIQRVQSIGFKAFLDEEFAATPSLFPNLPPFPGDSSVGCPTGSPANCFRDNYTMFPLQTAFFLNAIYGPDQLRQRVAWALSQIFVISGVTIEQPSSASPFWNIFYRGAFGNYRQLMYDVSVNPAMGTYLNMVNNDRRSGGLSPNENYARELLQLFTIGLQKLNPDGTLQLDGSGQPIPTYDQNTIINFARICTGWTYAPMPGASMMSHNPEYYLASMVPFENNHDRTAKTLLNGTTSPAGNTAKKDLVFALDNIFAHQNVAPFISKQLIQHLVTSNPSPAFVGRISAVFSDNGAGVKGDLKAVVLAILFDPEARGDVITDVDYGHLREPVQFIINICRAFNATTDAAGLITQAQNMSQDVWNSPTVFNYYRPNFEIPGTSVLGPEFTIRTSTTNIRHANFVSNVLGLNSPITGTTLDLSAYQTMATNPTALVDSLDTLLMHNTMSSGMKTKIVSTVSALPGVTSADLLKRARWAIYLVLTSGQYQIQR
jgi:uncharacterized protein (DUF1800 family)